MGLLAVDAYQVLGAVSLLLGITYLVRGANLPGRVGQIGYPRSAEWRGWTAAAPPGYWRAMGVGLGMFGAGMLLMAQGCFHHELFAFGVLAWVGGVAIGLEARSRYRPPAPRRTVRYWVVYVLSYTAFFVTMQVLINSGALNICHI